MLDREHTKEQRQRSILLQNRKWFDEHVRELQEKYATKLVAIHDCKVVAVGSTPEAVKKAIKGKYPEEETLMILVPYEPIVQPPYPSLITEEE